MDGLQQSSGQRLEVMDGLRSGWQTATLLFQKHLLHWEKKRRRIRNISQVANIYIYLNKVNACMYMYILWDSIYAYMLLILCHLDYLLFHWQLQYNCMYFVNHCVCPLGNKLSNSNSKEKKQHRIIIRDGENSMKGARERWRVRNSCLLSDTLLTLTPAHCAASASNCQSSWQAHLPARAALHCSAYN